MDRVKHTFNIELEHTTIICYVLDNGDKVIGSNIERILKRSFNADPIIALDSNGNEVSGYSINNVMDYFKPRTMRELARKGLITMVNENIAKSVKKSEPSEFDRLIKRALDFNPNK